MQPSCHHLSGSKHQSPDPGKHNDISVGISAMDAICKCSTQVSAIAAHVALSAFLYPPPPPPPPPPMPRSAWVSSRYLSSLFNLHTSVFACLSICFCHHAPFPPDTHTLSLFCCPSAHIHSVSLHISGLSLNCFLSLAVCCMNSSYITERS